MIKITDNEGELLVTLTDVVDKADFDARLSGEDQRLMEFLYDTPLFSDVVGADSLYGQKESDFDECPSECFVTTTYAEWIKGCLDWASGAIS